MNSSRVVSSIPVVPHTNAGRSRVLFVGSVLVAGVLLALSLHGVNLHEIVVTLHQTQPALLGVAAVALSASYFARGLRWRIQIGTAAPLSSQMAFWTTMTSFLTNNILPLRAGEVIRPVITSRVSGVGISYALACVLVEHVVDIAALVMMSFVASIAHITMPLWLRNGAGTFAVLGSIGTVLLFLLARMEHTLAKLLARIPIAGALSDRLQAILRRFALGLRSVRSLRDALWYLGLTVIIWLLDVLMGIAVASALHLSLSWPEITLLIVALSLTSAAPSTPANIGIWQIVAVALLGPFGITHAVAIAYILVFQVVTYGVETLWGAIGLWCITRA